MAIICRTTKQDINTCKCSRCHPHQEARYGHVQRQVASRQAGSKKLVLVRV
ncbi:hypothetical protein HYP85_gp017 [Pseudomonas phage Zuri]|uniref:Uncharacterized protein n=1 Tax=Pseudomonas phage Zuri TaxID=2604899 RepID=A0A5C1K6T6_9CAUD|nr:hypothetical protein HYP85_gp017 [Pseudomonas phage Zuri]QEM41114.1 hypothetical protein Zuri_17 [Pseudomonas phage Zuri]